MRIDCERVITQICEMFLKKHISHQYVITTLYFPINTLSNAHDYLIGGRRGVTMITGWRYVKTAVVVTDRNVVAYIHHSNLTGILYLSELLYMFQVKKIVPFMRTCCHGSTLDLYQSVDIYMYI